ncbi:MAG: hypothetical protein IKJ63_01985, partial [Clostridia bacterium]|nr:hypothetical protein [Clostridia bacterium]
MVLGILLNSFLNKNLYNSTFSYSYDKYYLIYQDEEYDIGTHAIGYDNLLGTLNLYGTFYEVLEDGSVVLIEEHEELQSTLTPKFYKL